MNVLGILTPTPIGDRPLLAYSIASMLLGAQALSLGLISELIVANTLRQPAFFALLQEETGGSGASVDVTNVDWWTSQLEALRPMGVEIGINLITAIVIFIVGRTIARMLSGTARKVMHTLRRTLPERRAVARTSRLQLRPV